MYVTNKTNGVEHLFVRLGGDKLGYTELYLKVKRQMIEEASDEEQEETLLSTLIQAGFIELQHGIPKAFLIAKRNRPMYISVHDGLNLLMTDIPINPAKYGCVGITGESRGIHIQPSTFL